MLLAAFVGLAGCDRDTSVPRKSPVSTASRGADGRVTVALGGQPFNLEVVANDATREQGLMGRSSMPADAGMAFVFGHDQVLKFWMRNTQIPLDIVYLDAGGKVVSVKRMYPFDETAVSSDAPARYAIELNQGTADRIGIKAGDVIALPQRVTQPPDLQ